MLARTAERGRRQQALLDHDLGDPEALFAAEDAHVQDVPGAPPRIGLRFDQHPGAQPVERAASDPALFDSGPAVSVGPRAMRTVPR